MTETTHEMFDKLFPFQAEDVTKLQEVPQVGIFNEMGTGKTYEAIALDVIRRGQTKHYNPKTLVVAPLSVLSSWEEHFNELRPDLKTNVINPKRRHDFLSAGADVYIMHWEAVRLIPELIKKPWCHIIADEAHRAKNRKAQQTKALKRVPGQFRTAVTGTPLINRPDELWSILNWLYPKAFTSYWRFFNRYVDSEIDYAQGGQYRKIKGPKNEAELQEMMSDFCVRRLKKDVLKDLPDKYYTSIWVDLTPSQRRSYDEMKKEMIAWVGANRDQALIAPVVIAQLTRLQQFALASVELEADGHAVLSEPSSKVDALMQILEDNPDEQVVVFTQFTGMIKLVEARLKKKGISYGLLTGDVSQQQRAENVRAFQEGKTNVFLGTIAAGGVGITLTAASTVIFLDRSWSPALNQQAEDRLHRHGQTNAVQVVDIMARGTVDLGRKQRLELKWEWIRKVLGDE